MLCLKHICVHIYIKRVASDFTNINLSCFYEQKQIEISSFVQVINDLLIFVRKQKFAFCKSISFFYHMQVDRRRRWKQIFKERILNKILKRQKSVNRQRIFHPHSIFKVWKVWFWLNDSRMTNFDTMLEFTDFSEDVIH